MTAVLVHLDVVELVLAVAAGKKGACEIPAGSNAGPFVERVLGVTGNAKGDPWCAANVADTGVIAFLAIGRKWVLPLTAGCQALADFAATRNVLTAIPQRGDVWLRWDAKRGRFSHAGWVLSVSPDRAHLDVQAGNTVRPTDNGSTREGWLDWTRTEPLNPKDRFVRWTELLERELANERAA